MDTEIKKTADGSTTLFVPALKEHYHSTNGAVQESLHVFIKSGLHALTFEKITILEMGFGTGLNALLTMRHAGQSKKIYYDSLEKFPLEWKQVEKMEYSTYLKLNSVDHDRFRQMHCSEWGRELDISRRFKLRKLNASLLEFEADKSYNLIYFDAFAPEVQPDLWSEAVFSKLYSFMENGAILVTYCAKGEVRRRMQRAGLHVERLPGPPGKREILRAKKYVY